MQIEQYGIWAKLSSPPTKNMPNPPKRELPLTQILKSLSTDHQWTVMLYYNGHHIGHLTNFPGDPLQLIADCVYGEGKWAKDKKTHTIPHGAPSTYITQRIKKAVFQ